MCRERLSEELKPRLFVPNLSKEQTGGREPASEARAVGVRPRRILPAQGARRREARNSMGSNPLAKTEPYAIIVLVRNRAPRVA